MDSSYTHQQELHNILLGITQNVYFRPPAKLCYPCIKYKRANIENVSADNIQYAQHTAYEITVIDTDCVSNIVVAVSKLKNCRHVRSFTSDGLYHDVFTLYY